MIIFNFIKFVTVSDAETLEQIQGPEFIEGLVQHDKGMFRKSIKS